MIKKEFQLLLRDRPAVILLALLVLGGLALMIATLFQLKISDVQVPVRYSEYGTANLYRDKWYALLGFTGFAALIAFFNSYLAVKMYSHYRAATLAFLGLSLLILIIATVVVIAVFRMAIQ